MIIMLRPIMMCMVVATVAIDVIMIAVRILVFIHTIVSISTTSMVAVSYTH